MCIVIYLRLFDMTRLEHGHYMLYVVLMFMIFYQCVNLSVGIWWWNFMLLHIFSLHIMVGPMSKSRRRGAIHLMREGLLYISTKFLCLRQFVSFKHLGSNTLGWSCIGDQTHSKSAGQSNGTFSKGASGHTSWWLCKSLHVLIICSPSSISFNGWNPGVYRVYISFLSLRCRSAPWSCLVEPPMFIC